VNNALSPVLAALSLAGLTVLASIGTLVDDVLRGFSVGVAVGSFIAYRRYQRQPALDPFPVITRWAAACTLLALLVAVAVAVL